MTIVGERGVSLSGGQRARVNLARAIYRQADLYLLDDPLSAVDTHVARHLYRKCITDYLAGKTRILVTHQLQFLKQADHIIVLDRVSVVSNAFSSNNISITLFNFLLKGFVKMQGGYDELVKLNKGFIEMMDSFNHEAEEKEENLRKMSVLSNRKISLMRHSSKLSITSSIAVRQP